MNLPQNSAPENQPLRLSVLIEAPRAAMTEIIARHSGVRELFDNGWLHLLELEGGRIAGRYRPGLLWTDEADLGEAA